MSKPELVDLEVDILKYETPRAYLLIIDGKEVWLPKSQVAYSDDDKKITLPEWLAIEKELV